MPTPLESVLPLETRIVCHLPHSRVRPITWWLKSLKFTAPRVSALLIQTWCPQHPTLLSWLAAFSCRRKSTGKRWMLTSGSVVSVGNAAHRCSEIWMNGLSHFFCLSTNANSPSPQLRGKGQKVEAVTSINISFLLRAREELSYCQEPLKA